MNLKNRILAAIYCALWSTTVEGFLGFPARKFGSRIGISVGSLSQWLTFLLPQLQKRSSRSSTQEGSDDGHDADSPSDIHAMRIHHSALKTRNITTAMAFYSLLGFQVQHKFRAGPARAAWLRLGSTPSPTSSCLELIEVPGYMLQEAPGTRKRAIDLNERPELLGWNHFAIDVTDAVAAGNDTTSLLDYVEQLNVTSLERFGKTLRVAVWPKQQLIGNEVYELAFLYDADGCLVELLNKQTELEQSIDSGWEPWDGQGFVGASEDG